MNWVCSRALVVHGADGLDEISLSGETLAPKCAKGLVRRYTLTPEDFGMARAPLETLRGGDGRRKCGAHSRSIRGQAGPRRDITVINAAAALVVAGMAENFRTAPELASGGDRLGPGARQKLAALVAFTN